jgi:hypothetical protein
MICDCCRRNVDYVRASFWHGDARICRECFAQWCNPDDEQIGITEASSIGNYVRLKHGLPPIAAALAIAALALASTAHASRHCLDQVEAGRTWPTRALVKDGDGCWTYDRRPPRAEVPIARPQMSPSFVPTRQSMLMDRWPETTLIQIEQRELEGEPIPEPNPPVNVRQFALFVSLVLAVVSIIEVATLRQGTRIGSTARPAGQRAYWVAKS